MRVVFALWPNPAHLYPLVPLAWALQSAGHEVRVASHPVLAESTLAVGLTPVAVGDPEIMPMGPGRPQPRSVKQRLDRITEALELTPADKEVWDVFYQFMLPSMWDFHPVGSTARDPHPVLDDLVAFAREWQPDLVLWDPCFPAGAVAARVAGAAQARLLWGLDYFASTMDRFAEAAARPGPGPEENPLVETMRPAAARYGLEIDDELLLGQWTVDPTPPGVRLPTSVRTVPTRWVPYSGQTVLPRWLHHRPERPRVALSLGLSQRMYFKGGWDHVPGLLEMVSDLDVEVVATLNADQLAGMPTLPKNVRAVDYLPLTQLLPSCSAMVHHGGMGTFASAVALRVPQLITDSDDDNGMITIEADGLEWSMATKHIESSVTARCVAGRGAGLVLDIKNLSVDAMRKQLVRVLDEPAFRQGADSLYDDLLATPSPTETVPVLEKLTRRYRA
ncbi:nucleotide disphospho-sugar-binding domain-containing protein [Micromonospora sp. WMMD737]|uniref:nucleotide disphospho-sugar-binding domain-containing protein n=1 Tax=Micromonospora sp. WMMD737 TaxID=3404113 RepID=UPI003B926933